MRDEGSQRRFLFAMLAVAIFLAPLLGLLLHIGAGLAAMAVALTATSVLLWAAVSDAPPRAQQPLRLLVALNLALAIGCLAALVWVVGWG